MNRCKLCGKLYIYDLPSHNTTDLKVKRAVEMKTSQAKDICFGQLSV